MSTRQESDAAPSRDRPPEIAARVAEKTAETWGRENYYLSAGIEIPMGVIATLSLVRRTDRDPDPAASLAALAPAELWRVMARLWGRLWMVRPELATWSRSLHGWLEEAEPGQQLIDAVYSVAQTALSAGLLRLTAEPDPYWRADADVLSACLTRLRSRGSREWLSEYHTPDDVAEILARITFAVKEPEPGQWLADPAAGTGGLLRAAAQQLRESDQDPRRYGWCMTDLDPIASACCAVNAVSFDLGPMVAVACADTLTDPEAPSRAKRERLEIIAYRDRLVAAGAAMAPAFGLLRAEPEAARATSPGRGICAGRSGD